MIGKKFNVTVLSATPETDMIEVFRLSRPSLLHTHNGIVSDNLGNSWTYDEYLGKLIDFDLSLSYFPVYTLSVESSILIRDFFYTFNTPGRWAFTHRNGMPEKLYVSEEVYSELDKPLYEEFEKKIQQWRRDEIDFDTARGYMPLSLSTQWSISLSIKALMRILGFLHYIVGDNQLFHTIWLEFYNKIPNFGRWSKLIKKYEYDSFNTPIREKEWEKTQEYANAVSLLSSTYDRVTREHPEWSLEERRAEAERVLFSRYAKEDVETRAERVDAKELLRRAETLDPKRDPEGLLQISSGFSSLNPVNRRALIGGFLRNPKLDSEQKSTLEALAGAPDSELARSQLITTEESIRRMEQMDPRNPRSFFGEHGNHLYKPITTLESHRILIQEKGEDGSIRLVEKEPKDVSSFDRPVTGLYPRDARIIRGTEIVPINALSTEDDLSLLDREPTGVHPDPSVPLYNPGAYPDQEVVRPTRDGALFYSNLTNRNKPLDDHMIITVFPVEGALPLPGMQIRNGNVVMMKRYGDCTEEMRKNAVTPPFDPDYRVLVKIRGKYRVIPLGDYLNYPYIRFVSSKPVDLMSSQEQIQLLLEE